MRRRTISPTVTPMDFAARHPQGRSCRGHDGNCPEFIWTIWGLGKLGAVTVPLNTAARGELLKYFITQSDSTLRRGLRGYWPIASPRRSAMITRCGRSARLAAPARLPNPAAPWSIWRRSPMPAREEPDPSQVSASDPQYIMYTSGTTGPVEGRDQPAFAGPWRRPIAGAEFRLSPGRHGLHLPAAVPWQRALVFVLCGVLGGLHAGGLRTVFRQ